MSNEVSNMEFENPKSENENKTKTAFLQVPYDLKDQVQAYMEEICTEAGSDFKVDSGNIEALPSHGCFLVISLDKIEEIIKGLKSGLSMEPDNGARNIKSEIRRVLNMLS